MFHGLSHREDTLPHELHFWNIVTSLETINSIVFGRFVIKVQLENSTSSDRDKCKQWIRYILQGECLHNNIMALLGEQDKLTQTYRPCAFLRNESIVKQFLNTLEELNNNYPTASTLLTTSILQFTNTAANAITSSNSNLGRLIFNETKCDYIDQVNIPITTNNDTTTSTTTRDKMTRRSQYPTSK